MNNSDAELTWEESKSMYPAPFPPDSVEKFAVSNGVLEVPSSHSTLKRWTHEPIADTWGGKALIDYKGVAMFAELALTHMAIDRGWKAR